MFFTPKEKTINSENRIPCKYEMPDKILKMNLDLTNKTALVCGASQGLGLASATELALMGSNVIAVSRNENKLRSAIQNFDTSKGQQHGFLVMDLSSPE